MAPASKPLVAITGGTGFLGPFIIQALTRAGYKLRLLVRREPMHPLIPDLDAELVFGDVADQAALERLCQGADVIVHAAGLIKAKTRADFFQVNAGGSAQLARAAAKIAPKAHLVVVSSLAAREPALSDYAASKQAGEAAIQETTPGIVTILRPSAIYGRWDKETFALFQMASRGVVFAPKAPNARVCLIHASDVAAAVAALARREKTNAIYELSDGNLSGYTWHEMAAEAGRAVGKSPRNIGIPPIILSTSGILSENFARLVGRTPMLTSGKIREMLHGDWSSSPDQQPPPAIWQPKIKLAPGFLDTAKWYADNNWL